MLVRFRAVLSLGYALMKSPQKYVSRVAFGIILLANDFSEEFTSVAVVLLYTKFDFNPNTAGKSESKEMFRLKLTLPVFL